MIIQLLALVLTVRKSNETSCGRDHSPTVSNLREMLRTHVCHLSIDPLQRLFLFPLRGWGGGGTFDARQRDNDGVFVTKLDHSLACCVFLLLVAVFIASNIRGKTNNTMTLGTALY